MGVGLLVGRCALVGQTTAQARRDLAVGEPGATDASAGLLVPDLPDPVRLELGRLEERADRALGPGDLLGRLGELALGLGPRLGRERLGGGLRVADQLVGVLAQRLGLRRRLRAEDVDVVGGLLAKSGDLGVGGSQELSCPGVRLGGPGLDQVAGLGVLLVGVGPGRRDESLGPLPGLGAEPFGGGQHLVLGRLGRLEPCRGRGLRLGQDLVVVGLGGLHERRAWSPASATICCASPELSSRSRWASDRSRLASAWSRAASSWSSRASSARDAKSSSARACSSSATRWA